MVEQKEMITVREAGRRGGITLRDAMAGTEYYARIGRKGALSPKRKHPAPNTAF